MSDMAKPTGLFRRKGTYYYRTRVPKDLVSAFGKTEIRISLKTKNYDEAKKRRNQVAVEWDARFDEVRKSLEQDASASAKPLTRPEAVRLVRDYVERGDREWQDDDAKSAHDTIEAKREHLIDLTMAEDMLTDPGDPRQDQEVSQTSTRILDGSGFELGEDGIPYGELRELVRRGLLELYRRATARSKDDYSASYFDHLFAPNGQVTIADNGTSFGELCDQYFEIYREEAQTNGIQQKRVDKVKAHLGLVREIMGDDRSVATIDYDRCIAFRKTLARVPARRRQFYDEMPLPKVIDVAKKDGKPMMGYVTQAGYLQALTQVLRLARRKKLITDVPSEGLTPIAKKTPDEHKREPFSAEQLKAIFHSDYYAECAQHGYHPYLNAKKSSRFWLPLISLLTGMRPKEICQMHVADVKVSDDDVHFFHVIADDDDKTVKTPTSQRKFPVHPELVRMGFLDHVEVVRKQGHKRIFHELTKDKYGNYSTYILRRFREKFLPDVIEVSEKQTFYSFRHNFRDALRDIEAPPEILQALGAWSQGNLVSDSYGEGFKVDHLMKYVEKIEYPGLDLSHLHVKGSGNS